MRQTRFDALAEKAARIADTSSGTTENHVLGKLGEFSLASYLGIEDRVNTDVYTDGGDGGVDLEYQGTTIDVKTVGRHRRRPPLTVDAHEPLPADYYVLASRVGKMNCRLVGYAPRQFVATAPVWYNDGSPYHVVDQRFLFPFPSI